ncbi:MAG: lyase family protein [Acetobacteraceae bacterium]
MAVSALDSALVSPLFLSGEMASLWSEPSLIRAMLEVEAALAWAQSEVGLAPRGLAEAIGAIGPEAFEAEAIGRSTAHSAVPAIGFLARLESLLPADLSWALHRGATSQDLLDTAMALLSARSFRLLAADLAETLQALAALARRHAGLACVGRTYGQHAAPVTFGAKAGQWAAGLAEIGAELAALERTVARASLAGPVGTGASFGPCAESVAARFAARLGLGHEPVPWHGRRWRIARAGCWLAGLIGAAAKMATDLDSLLSTEIGEVVERDGEGRGGSSAMPHKRNPVSATAILAAHRLAPGLAATLLGAMDVAHERGGGGWQAEWHAVPSLFGLASGALRETHRLARSVEPVAGRMAANLALSRGLVFADRAADALVPRLGRAGASRAVATACDGVRRGAFADLAEALRSAGHGEAAARCMPDDAIAAGARLAEAAAAEAVSVAGALRALAGEGRKP